MPTDKILHFSSFAFHNYNISPFPHFPKSVYFSFLFGLILDKTESPPKEKEMHLIHYSLLCLENCLEPWLCFFYELSKL